MKNEINSDAGTYTDVRYSKGYSILVIGLAMLFIIMGIKYIYDVHSIVFAVVFLIVGLLFLYAGVTLSSRKYFRHDKQNRVLLVFGVIGPFSGKYPYDRIYLEGKELFIEKNDKKKRLNIFNYACNKEDLNIFIKEIAG